jgi:ATP-dependent exoDNAse (exonuclease V) alpha subunit
MQFGIKSDAPVVTPEEVKLAVHEAITENALGDSVIEGPHPETRPAPESSPDDSINDTEDRITGNAKLSRLIDEDFPFDESQLAAIHCLNQEQYGALTGAAGTGKTTTTKKIVDTIVESGDLEEVDMKGYWKKGVVETGDDDYVAPESWVPSVAMCAFTGRATQMIKKNFPRDWHGNIMTIHRMLGFYPETYEGWDEEQGKYRTKMRFVPTYTADLKLPWDVIIIDEAGMLGIELWEQLWAACKDGCRIYMIGDINQLPPVHGKSVFGFAMLNWPSWELTHVHRQQGTNNSIVDNAWRILAGRMPESDPDGADWKFKMIELKGDASEANRRLRAIAPRLKEIGVYDPIRDSIITPINGEEGARGFQLGQLPLNRAFALEFNPASQHPRYIIDAGRERKQFAVGDKVMATKNDWEAGITNGMTGVITEIAENGEYSGDRRLFGTVEEVNAYLRESPEQEMANAPAFSLEELEESMELEESKTKEKEKRDRGPASHIVTVRFGEAEHAIEVPFASLSEVGTLMTAYVVTCHKMQGGEAPVILIVVHSAHRMMLYREWLYTAVTRASEKCIILFSPDAMRSCLNKQKIVGSTLKEKVAAFNASQEGGLSRQPTLPISHSTGNRLMDRKEGDKFLPARLQSKAVKEGGLAKLIAKSQERAVAKAEPKPMDFSKLEVPTRPTPKPETVRVIHEHVLRVQIVEGAKPTPRADPIDGGELKPETNYQRINREFKEKHDRLPTNDEVRLIIIDESRPAPKALPAPTPIKLVSQWGAAHAKVRIEQERDQSRFLLAAPAPAAPVNPFALKFGIKS